MMRISRRSFMAAGAAGAALNAIPFSSWIQDQAFAQGPRTRHSAYSPQGKAMLKKYEMAVAEMMDTSKTPESDPRSWTFQWYTHFVKDTTDKESEIDRIYPQPDAPHRALAEDMWDTCQAHNGQNEDFFLPWHRMYVYYFEMIIREMSHDPDFTLPYWNYSSSADAAIPPEFRVSTSSLYRGNRNPGVNEGSKIPANQVRLDALRQKTYGQNGAAGGFCADLDFGLHGNVHVWVGDGEGMGSVPWAARDPVFWMHHCNIDRLWASWNRGNCKNPTYQEWREATFVFSDTKGQKVVATVQDVDDIDKLKYTYDAFEPASCPALVAQVNPTVLASVAASAPVTRTPVRVVLAPPPTAAAQPGALRAQLKALAPTKSVYLVMQDVHAMAPVGVHYDVYLDLPQGATPSPESPNYVGTINFFGVTMSRGMNAMKPRTFSFDVTDKMPVLGNAASSQPPTVTLVPSGEPSQNAQPMIGRVELTVQ